MGEDLGKTLASELTKTNGRKIKKITNIFDTVEAAMILLKLCQENKCSQMTMCMYIIAM